MMDNDSLPQATRAIVSAGLPEFPGVPAEVGPLACRVCGEHAAVVRHVVKDGVDMSASVECGHCGDRLELWMDSYSIGLAIGVIVAAAARRGDPRVATVG